MSKENATLLLLLIACNCTNCSHISVTQCHSRLLYLIIIEFASQTGSLSQLDKSPLKDLQIDLILSLTSSHESIIIKRSPLYQHSGEQLDINSGSVIDYYSIG